jgi:hypothetical protein
LSMPSWVWSVTLLNTLLLTFSTGSDRLTLPYTYNSASTIFLVRWIRKSIFILFSRNTKFYTKVKFLWKHVVKKSKWKCLTILF